MTIALRANLVVTFLFFVGGAVEASPVLFLVRHAEKATTGGDEPELPAPGQQRAAALARILKDSEIRPLRRLQKQRR